MANADLTCPEEEPSAPSGAVGIAGGQLYYLPQPQSPSQKQPFFVHEISTNQKGTLFGTV